MRQEKIFDAWAWRFHAWGVRPNHLTMLQAPLLGALAYAGLNREFAAFAALQILVILVDGADGILARRTGTTTRRGHLLDSLFDIIGIGVTLWVVSYWFGDDRFYGVRIDQLAFALLFLNFLVYLQNEIQGTKAITYTRGPTTIALYFENSMPGLMGWALLLPLVLGTLLMATRLRLRQRVWNYYQYLTAGQRQQYKAIPRSERHTLTTLPERDAPGPSPRAPRGSKPPSAAPPPRPTRATRSSRNEPGR